VITKKEFYLLYNKNSPRNRKRNIGPIDAKLFLRDLSLPVAYLLAKFGISANAITILFLLISIAGNVLFAIPSLLTLILLIVLQELAQMLDCVDGQLARYYGVSSKYGEDFDSVAHILTSGTFMLALGLRFYFQTGLVVFLVLGGIGAFSKAFEHQLEISDDSIVKNESIAKFIKGSFVRKLFVYSFQSLISGVRFYAMLLLILTLLEAFLNFELAAASVVFYVAIVFADSLLYKVYLTYRKLAIVERKKFGGWS